MDQADDIALDVDQLSKTFQSNGRAVQALDKVSFRVRHGMVTGLIGPDSAGKTTLMRLAAGLLVPDSGSITVLGMDAATQSLAVQGASATCRNDSACMKTSPCRRTSTSTQTCRACRIGARRSLPRTDAHGRTEPFTRRLAGRLSGGMKQKLGLACAPGAPAALLLLDEPTVGVDPLSRRELWAIVYRLVRKKGTTVLLSTAYLDEAERCDEMFLLHHGKTAGSGAIRRVQRDRMQGAKLSGPSPQRG